MFETEKEIVIGMETWRELTSTSERMVESCGLIGANLDLALDGRNTKAARAAVLANALRLANLSHFLAKKFLALWTIAEEQGRWRVNEEVSSQRAEEFVVRDEGLPPRPKGRFQNAT